MFEDYISKKTIRYWLDHYESLAADDRPYDQLPTNSGPKEIDGVSLMQLNKVMLDDAIDKLPFETQVCCKARWVYKVPVRKTRDALGITRQNYYDNCDKAIKYIHDYLNGSLIGVKQIINRLDKTPIK